MSTDFPRVRLDANGHIMAYADVNDKAQTYEYMREFAAWLITLSSASPDLKSRVNKFYTDLKTAVTSNGQAFTITGDLPAHSTYAELVRAYNDEISNGTAQQPAASQPPASAPASAVPAPPAQANQTTLQPPAAPAANGNGTPASPPAARTHQHYVPAPAATDADVDAPPPWFSAFTGPISTWAQTVDSTLDNHEDRISALERGEVFGSGGSDHPRRLPSFLGSNRTDVDRVDDDFPWSSLLRAFVIGFIVVGLIATLIAILFGGSAVVWAITHTGLRWGLVGGLAWSVLYVIQWFTNSNRSARDSRV